MSMASTNWALSMANWLAIMRAISSLRVLKASWKLRTCRTKRSAFGEQHSHRQCRMAKDFSNAIAKEDAKAESANASPTMFRAIQNVTPILPLAITKIPNDLPILFVVKNSLLSYYIFCYCSWHLL
jgi:hypothetical protein